MAGPAEGAISSKHGELCRQIADWPRPAYDSATAFRFVYDRSADRSIADASAVATQLHVLLKAVVEHDLTVPKGPEPGTAQARPDETKPADTKAGENATAGDNTTAGDKAGENTTAGEKTDASKPGFDLPSIESLLAQPSTVAGREWAERACRALARELFSEAEELFLGGAEQVPTDPFAWFGAGLAAINLEPSRAVGHFTLASRYLAIDDPAGAIHVDAIIAALLESLGDRRSAVLYLERRLGELKTEHGACPFLYLHLARLDAGHQRDVDTAVTLDPLLEVDAQALGLELNGTDAGKRAEKTEAEIKLIYQHVDALSKVDDLRHDPEAPSGEFTESEGTPLRLSRLEVRLRRAIDDCERQIDRAREAMEMRERERQALAAKLKATKTLADEAMTAPVALSYLLLSVVASVSIILATIMGWRLVASFGSSTAVLPVALLVVILAGLLIWLAGYGLSGILRPKKPTSRRFPLARHRQAKSAEMLLPVVDRQCWDAYEQELLVRRRFERCRADAVYVLDRTKRRRQHLVPRRPDFKAKNLPLVPSRRVTITA